MVKRLWRVDCDPEELLLLDANPREETLSNLTQQCPLRAQGNCSPATQPQKRVLTFWRLSRPRTPWNESAAWLPSRCTDVQRISLDADPFGIVSDFGEVYLCGFLDYCLVSLFLGPGTSHAWVVPGQAWKNLETSRCSITALEMTEQNSELKGVVPRRSKKNVHIS